MEYGVNRFLLVLRMIMRMKNFRKLKRIKDNMVGKVTNFENDVQVILLKRISLYKYNILQEKQKDMNCIRRCFMKFDGIINKRKTLKITNV